MRLNVHLISHPIIQKLATDIREIIFKQKRHQYNYHMFHLLHILLIHEVTRKWITTYNIYIPKIDSIQKLCVFEPKESYLIMTNLLHYGNIVLDINNILPKVDIEHINLEKHNDFDDIFLNLNTKLNNLIKQKKIIVMYDFLNYSLVKLLDHLIAEQDIQITQIKILCITCTNTILEYIGRKYPLIDIYTTQICTY